MWSVQLWGPLSMFAQWGMDQAAGGFCEHMHSRGGLTPEDFISTCRAWWVCKQLTFLLYPPAGRWHHRIEHLWWSSPWGKYTVIPFLGKYSGSAHLTPPLASGSGVEESWENPTPDAAPIPGCKTISIPASIASWGLCQPSIRPETNTKGRTRVSAQVVL